MRVIIYDICLMSSDSYKTEKSENQEPDERVLMEAIFDNIQHSQKVKLHILKNMVQGDPYSQCLVSLVALHYNLVIDEHSANQETQRQAKLMQRNRFFMLNQMLPIISRLTSYPEPAQYLANFEFNAFTQCCERTGNDALVRQSKGLFPYMNCDQFLIPSFIPFREHLHYRPTGNQNWKQARQVLQQRYKTTKNVAQSIRLCYKILLGEQSLREYNKQNMWNRLWSELYLQFLDIGTKRILKYGNLKMEQNALKILALQDNQAFHISQNEYNQKLRGSNGQGQASADRFVLQLIKLLLHNEIQLLPGIIEKLCQFQANFPTMLAISMLFKVFQKKNMKSQCGICINKFLQYQYHKQLKHDYFMKVFLTTQEITRYYQDTVDIQIPEARFNKEIMQIVSQRMIEKQPQNILKLVKYLQGYDKLMMILQSPFLAHLNIGSELVDILREQKPTNIQMLQNRMNTAGIAKDYENYLQSWEFFHNVLRQGGIRSSSNLIKSSYIYTEEFQRLVNYPQKRPENVYKILHTYSSVLAKWAQKKRNSRMKDKEQHEALYGRGRLYNGKEFKNLLNRLEKREVDQIWSILSVVLMSDSDLMEDLLQVS